MTTADEVIAEIRRASMETNDMALVDALSVQLGIVLPAMRRHTDALAAACAASRVPNPFLKGD